MQRRKGDTSVRRKKRIREEAQESYFSIVSYASRLCASLASPRSLPAEPLHIK